MPASEFLLGLPTDPAHVAISSANLNSNNYLLLALLQAQPAFLLLQKLTALQVSPPNSSPTGFVVTTHRRKCLAHTGQCHTATHRTLLPCLNILSKLNCLNLLQMILSIDNKQAQLLQMLEIHLSIAGPKHWRRVLSLRKDVCLINSPKFLNSCASLILVLISRPINLHDSYLYIYSAFSF